MCVTNEWCLLIYVVSYLVNLVNIPKTLMKIYHTEM